MIKLTREQAALCRMALLAYVTADKQLDKDITDLSNHLAGELRK